MAGVSLLVGLGNPGGKYEKTRHNAGFWFVDAVLRKYGGLLRPNSRFAGDLADISVGPHSLRVLQPTTYMNESGRSVGAVAKFYRIPADSILIAHDEIDLPAGTVRLKRGGGHGGHNGLRDIIPQLGGPGFARLRIGVGHPGDKKQVINFVLKPPGGQEQRAIDDSIARALDEFEMICAGEWERAMHQLHTAKD